MKPTKKLLAAALAAVMLIGMIPAFALAADTVDSGACGESASWTLDSDGLLTVSGTGKASIDKEKWSEVKKQAVTAVVEDGITVIGGGLFSGFEKLTTVTLPESVDVIESSAFANSAALETVTLPSEASEIQSRTFENCSMLKTVTLPKGITSVPFAMFRNSGVEGVTIPDTVTTIYDDTFLYCLRLENVTVPSGVTVIMGRAFAWSELKEVKFEGDAPKIDSTAFEQVTANALCPKDNHTWDSAKLPYGGDLTWGIFDPETGEIYLDQLPEGVKAQGRLNDGITWSLSDDNVLTILGTGKIEVENGDYPWKQYQRDVAKIIIGDGIVSIGNGAFAAFQFVTEAVLGKDVETVGDEAFSECMRMTDINLPDSLKTIGDFAFQRCGFTSLDIPAGVTSIGKNAFRASELTTVSLPDSLTALADYTFYDCNMLKEITLPNALETIGDNAFGSCSSIKSIEIPSKVKKIGASAFRGCSNIKQIVFTGDAPEIAPDAFTYVTANVYIPVNNKTWTDDKIQYYGGELTWYYYDPDYVPTVVDSGMIGDVKWEYYDNGLLDITGSGAIPDYTAPDGASPAPWAKHREETYVISVGDGITAIGENAFNGFTSLEEVDFYGDAPEIAGNAFTGVNSYAACYIFAAGWTEDKFAGYGGNLLWYYMYLRGDINCDGQLSNSDLITMARFVVNLYPADSAEYTAVLTFGDMDGDEKVINTDIVRLARILVGLN